MHPAEPRISYNPRNDGNHDQRQTLEQLRAQIEKSRSDSIKQAVSRIPGKSSSSTQSPPSRVRKSTKRRYQQPVPLNPHQPVTTYKLGKDSCLERTNTVVGEGITPKRLTSEEIARSQLASASTLHQIGHYQGQPSAQQRQPLKQYQPAQQPQHTLESLGFPGQISISPIDQAAVNISAMPLKALYTPEYPCSTTNQPAPYHISEGSHSNHSAALALPSQLSPNQDHCLVEDGFLVRDAFLTVNPLDNYLFNSGTTREEFIQEFWSGLV